MATINEQAKDWVLRGNVENHPNTPSTFRVIADEVGNVQAFGDALRELRSRHKADITISNAFDTMSITTTPENWEKLKAGIRYEDKITA